MINRRPAENREHYVSRQEARSRTQRDQSLNTHRRHTADNHHRIEEYFSERTGKRPTNRRTIANTQLSKNERTTCQHNAKKYHLPPWKNLTRSITKERPQDLPKEEIRVMTTHNTTTVMSCQQTTTFRFKTRTTHQIPRCLAKRLAGTANTQKATRSAWVRMGRKNRPKLTADAFEKPENERTESQPRRFWTEWQRNFTQKNQEGQNRKKLKEKYGDKDETHTLHHRLHRNKKQQRLSKDKKRTKEDPQNRQDYHHWN
jgi:hypothetical protein